MTLEIAKFNWPRGFEGLRRIIVPNLVKIGPSIAEILRFFKVMAVRHLGFVWGYLDHPRRILGDPCHCAIYAYRTDAAVSIIMYYSFNIWRDWLENEYSPPPPPKKKGVRGWERFNFLIRCSMKESHKRHIIV